MSKKKDKGKDAERSGDAAATPAAADTPRIGAHPRAATAIRRLRGRAGLAAFVVCLALSLRADLPLFDAVARGLVAGIAAQFVAWFAGVLVWRHLIVGELAAHREALDAARAERQAAAEAARAAGA